ncbi:MAG: PilT/PilU family type 4a pilus ATPase [Pseudomonadota bacterium]
MNFNDFLQIGVAKGASDLHFLPGMRPLMRLNGSLAEIKEAPVLTPEDTKQLLFGIMSPVEQAVFEEKRVCELSLTVPNIGHFRVSIFHQKNGVAAVLRVIPEAVPVFESLNLPPVLKTLLGLSHGLILVTGPAGSGKSTSIAGMLNYINQYRACHIITIEDPIEFVYENKKSVFNQLQVGRDTPDFAAALRSSLRQDPNVINIGELRDLETMRLALTAAETGHLVLGTLHASTAPMAVGRFVDVFPAHEKAMVRGMLSETLQAIIGQTLVKSNKGGRVAAFEVLMATTAMRHYIRRDMPSHMDSAMQTGGNVGMCTLEQSLNELIGKNIINQAVAANIIAMRGTFREIQESPEGKGKK